MILCNNCQRPLVSSDIIGGGICRYCGGLAYGPVVLANRWYEGADRPCDTGVYLWLRESDGACFTMQWDQRQRCWIGDMGGRVEEKPDFWAGPIRYLRFVP